MIRAIPALIFLVAHAALAVQPTPTVTGYWEGAIRLPGTDLAIQVNLVRGSGEDLQGYLSIPAQRLDDGKLDDLVFDPPEISCRMADIPGNPTFKGRIDGDVIKGDFTQGGRTFTFELKRTGDARPIVEAALPGGLIERDITVGESPWVLPGTLTLPAGKGPFPAVVLVHGSGPSDRDEKVGGSRPFRDIAWGLAQKGIAVLRYDKRTLVHGSKVGEIKNLTLNDETVDDAVLAVKAAGQVQEINGGKIIVLGHSLGGYALGRIAEKSPDAAGFISLAGAARPLEDFLPEQLSYLGAPEDMIKQAKEAAARIKSKDLTPDTPASELKGIPASYWLDLRGYDPVAALAKAKRPALILQGEADYQVTSADFALWKKGFPDATHKSFPKLNHLFMPTEGKSMPADYLKEGQRVDPVVIQTIAEWVEQYGNRKL